MTAVNVIESRYLDLNISTDNRHNETESCDDFTLTWVYILDEETTVSLHLHGKVLNVNLNTVLFL